MAGDERSLATWLASLDDAALAQLFDARGVSRSAGWNDFFDAADALLDAASIDKALQHVDRRDLVALAAAVDGDASAPHLAVRALTRPDGAPYAAVRERVQTLRTQRPDAFTPADAASALPADADEHARAAELIFTASASLADVVLSALHVPLTRTGAGAVSAADRKRLVESGAIVTPEDLDDLLSAGLSARICTVIGRELIVTAAGEQWLDAGTADRWARVAQGLRDALPKGLRTPGGGVIASNLWPGAYPLDPGWSETASALRRAWVRWGLLSDDGHLPPWAEPLCSGGSPDTDAVRAALPTEIDRIYLQADLTAVAPGPLAPRLDLRLRGIARRESRAQASTYRFTAESIGAGLTEGESAESIRDFLSELSLTGIPQPLEYVIETTAARHGSLTVRSEASTHSSIVESTDPHLLDLVNVDQALRPVGLVRDGDRLLSRVSRDHLFWALADARYPVVALGADGQPESLRRRTANDADGARDASAAYEHLVTTLRASGGEDDAAWLERELDQAVRMKAEIVVTVRVSGTEERTFTLEATGLGGGRLRGRDRAADVERTLPISMITAVRPAVRT